MVSRLLKDSCMVEEMAGVAVVLLTKLTSLLPVSSQRSTVTTYCAKSTVLPHANQSYNAFGMVEGFGPQQLT